MINEFIRLLTVTVPWGESMLCTIGSNSDAQRYLILITATSAACDRLHQAPAARQIARHSSIVTVNLF
jgi:hypothetical protein